jgi:hypothetical protein
MSVLVGSRQSHCHQTSDLRVGGSNPSGRTIVPDAGLVHFEDLHLIYPGAFCTISLGSTKWSSQSSAAKSSDHIWTITFFNFASSTKIRIC